ncbi:SusC/RagA family TonB-linked outer membrane protein [Filimonas effusa]|uniref:TonB-dependent receptor n=1 Tax=Filimonas effusa TaxID=2508721 RepID=A0A4Q1DBY4_9BACT|nr:TonB-dependent receptor [Filimonas effusa]RXK86840.1 TonB-dependent receptor [Filimonas effusa]
MWRFNHRIKRYSIVAGTSVILALLGTNPLPAFAQEPAAPASGVRAKRTVKGRVTDATGKPLAGVTVTQKGTSVAVVTNQDGAYSINVPSGQNIVLEFSNIGFAGKELTLTPQSTAADIQLQEAANSLNEVIVVGYGTRKKETLTGAVTTVSAKMFQNKGTVASPLQAMQGQVPGVIITRSSAAPGDESWAVKLRGAVSANATEPLVIVDGVALDSYRELRLINSNDIENINFLKDASAAIYGSRAAGGVILVTTKKAKAGKSAVEFNSTYSHKIVGLQPRLMNIDQWANGVIEARTNDGYGADDVWIRYANLAMANKDGYINLLNSANPIPNFGDIKDYVFLDNNWTDILWGNAGATQQDISLSGGSDRSTYRLSLGYFGDDGTLQWGNNNNKRYNLRLNNNLKVSDWFSIESVIAYNKQHQLSPSMIGSVLGQGYAQPGLPAATLNGKPYAWGGQYTPNWFAELGGDNKLNVTSLNISENLRFNLRSDLKLVVNLGYNNSFAQRNVQQNSIQWYNYAGTLQVQTNPTQPATYFSRSTASTDFYSASAYLQYDKTIAGDHHIAATLGTQYEYNQYDYYWARVFNINSSLGVLNGSGEVQIVDPANASNKTTRNHYAVGSYFGRFNYDYKSKYLLEANGRYDGSSKFAPANRWNFFYGLSGGWRISKENFFRHNASLSFINELKLRASYGIVGNQSGIDMYDGVQLLNMVSGTGAYIGDGLATYVTTTGTMVSYNRTWEKIHNYNIGFDYALLKNHLTGSVDWFKKKNNNMLLSQTYPGILGANAPKANIGEFEGHGWEATLNWSGDLGKVHYTVGGAFTCAKNKLLNFGGANVVKQGFNSAVEGSPLNAIFGLKLDGRIQTEKQRQDYLDKYNIGNAIGLSSAIRVGDNMYKDVNNDGVLDMKDLVYLGTDDPQISYAFNIGADWKGFDCSLVFQGAGQRTTFRDDVNWRIPFRSVYLNTTDQSVGNHWTPENRAAFFPKYSTNSAVNNYNYQASDWSAENGAYIRLKNIVLGYTLPAAVLSKIRFISRLRIYAAASDIWEYSYINDGWDPEATRTVSAAQRYPFNRVITGGINVTF